MKDNRINFFMPIEKVEKQSDGSRIITGYASTPTKDLDDEIISLDAVKNALPDYMEWRNIREMHQPKAVGVAKEAHIDSNGLYLKAKIVEPGCIHLIDEGVLKAFSVGGRKLAKTGDTITEIELIEISVVDRPSNNDCMFSIAKMAAKGTKISEPLYKYGSLIKLSKESGDPVVTLDRDEVGFIGRLMMKFAGQRPEPTPSIDALGKRDVSDKERSDLEAQGRAMPGGGFPINDRTDLGNAIQAFGRAKNKAATKRFIVREARRLKATDMLPSEWPGSTKKDDTSKLAKSANLYTVSNMIGLLGQLEYLEECCEGDAGGGNGCAPSFCFMVGETKVTVPREFTEKFGAMLVQFGDMTAELLDMLLTEMKREEDQEAAVEAMAKAAVDIRKGIEEAKAKPNPKPLAFEVDGQTDGDDAPDVFAKLSEIAKTAPKETQRSKRLGNVFAELKQLYPH